MGQFTDEQLDYLWKRLSGELKNLEEAFGRTSPIEPSDIDRRIKLLREIANVKRGLEDIEGCDRASPAAAR